MYRPLSSNVALCITISPVVLFSETFSHLVEFFSLLHDVYAFKFPPALEIALTVWCSLTVRDWGEKRTSGGEMDSPGAPLSPGTPRGPGGPLGPSKPRGPCGPDIPGFPVLPCGPLTPGGPIFTVSTRSSSSSSTGLSRHSWCTGLSRHAWWSLQYKMLGSWVQLEETLLKLDQRLHRVF